MFSTKFYFKYFMICLAKVDKNSACNGSAESIIASHYISGIAEEERITLK